MPPAPHSYFWCKKERTTRPSWFNCALRDDEAVYWVIIGHYEAVEVGNWLYWVSRGHLCLYILHKVEIWTGVTDAWQTDSHLKDRATQLLIKYKSGALVTQFISGRYYLLRYVAPPERRSCDLQPTDYQIMVVKMITSHPSRVADHLPEQLIAMTWEKVIISTWQWGQWR